MSSSKNILNLHGAGAAPDLLDYDVDTFADLLAGGELSMFPPGSPLHQLPAHDNVFPWNAGPFHEENSSTFDNFACNEVPSLQNGPVAQPLPPASRLDGPVVQPPAASLTTSATAAGSVQPAVAGSRAVRPSSPEPPSYLARMTFGFEDSSDNPTPLLDEYNKPEYGAGRLINAYQLVFTEEEEEVASPTRSRPTTPGAANASPSPTFIQKGSDEHAEGSNPSPDAWKSGLCPPKASTRPQGSACPCGRPDTGEMVCCENTRSHGGDLWFHFGCVGLEVAPEEDEEWVCQWCDPSSPSDDDYSDDNGKKRKHTASRQSGMAEPSKKRRISSRAESNRPVAASAGSNDSAFVPSAPPAGPASGSTRKGISKPLPWSAAEQAHAVTEMRRLLAGGSQHGRGDLFGRLSTALAQNHGVDRSANACKNFWNRYGRQQSGLDERKKPNPEQLAISQLPAQKQRARQVLAPPTTPAAAVPSGTAPGMVTSGADEERKESLSQDNVEEEEEAGEEVEKSGAKAAGAGEGAVAERSAGGDGEAAAEEAQPGETDEDFARRLSQLEALRERSRRRR